VQNGIGENGTNGMVPKMGPRSRRKWYEGHGPKKKN